MRAKDKFKKFSPASMVVIKHIVGQNLTLALNYSKLSM